MPCYINTLLHNNTNIQQILNITFLICLSILIVKAIILYCFNYFYHILIIFKGEYLTGISTSGQRGPGSNGNKGVHHIPYYFRTAV